MFGLKWFLTATPHSCQPVAVGGNKFDKFKTGSYADAAFRPDN